MKVFEAHDVTAWDDSNVPNSSVAQVTITKINRSGKFPREKRYPEQLLKMDFPEKREKKLFATKERDFMRL